MSCSLAPECWCRFGLICRTLCLDTINLGLWLGGGMWWAYSSNRVTVIGFLRVTLDHDWVDGIWNKQLSLNFDRDEWNNDFCDYHPTCFVTIAQLMRVLRVGLVVLMSSSTISIIVVSRVSRLDSWISPCTNCRTYLGTEKVPLSILSILLNHKVSQNVSPRWPINSSVVVK